MILRLCALCLFLLSLVAISTATSTRASADEVKRLQELLSRTPLDSPFRAGIAGRLEAALQCERNLLSELADSVVSTAHENAILEMARHQPAPSSVVEGQTHTRLSVIEGSRDETDARIDRTPVTYANLVDLLKDLRVTAGRPMTEHAFELHADALHAVIRDIKPRPLLHKRVTELGVLSEIVKLAVDGIYYGERQPGPAHDNPLRAFMFALFYDDGPTMRERHALQTALFAGLNEADLIRFDRYLEPFIAMWLLNRPADLPVMALEQEALANIRFAAESSPILRELQF